MKAAHSIKLDQPVKERKFKRTTKKLVTPAKKVFRLEARINAEQKELFQYAADLAGRTVTDFLVSTMHEKATQLIEEHQTIRLSMEESKRFVATLLNPPKPSTRLQAAAKLHKKMGL